MDLGLKGRRALVTGASRGIGLAIAERLATEGCAVAICARGADGVESALDRLRAAGAPAVFGAALDVADADALEAFVAGAADALGGLDLLVANAGGAVGGPLLADADAAAWRATLDLNVVHTTTAARAAAPVMRAGGGGAMLFIASVSGLRPQPRPQYAAAKAALIHLAASLARELGRDGIRVNALSPGSIRFEGGSWERRAVEEREAFEAFVAAELPFGRLGTLAEVADAAAFLLSARAGWISGANLVVDGAQLQPTMTGY